MSHIALVFSCLLLLGVIALQDYKVPALRNQTISSGLTGPYHALLDASYVPLSISLVWATYGHWGMFVFAVIAALALLLVAATNTAWKFFNAITEDQHSLWHTRATITVFVSALLLVVVQGGLWGLVILIPPAAAYLRFRFWPTTVKGVVIAASPAAEKLYVLGLCLSFIVWAVVCPA